MLTGGPVVLTGGPVVLTGGPVVLTGGLVVRSGGVDSHNEEPLRHLNPKVTPQ